MGLIAVAVKTTLFYLSSSSNFSLFSTVFVTIFAYMTFQILFRHIVLNQLTTLILSWSKLKKSVILSKF